MQEKQAPRLSRRLSVDQYAAGVRSGDRSMLARAITLIESQREADQALAQALLQKLLPLTGKARRIGVTGVPGVGKSTFLDGFGRHLLEKGLRVAVLAIDPSSALTGGSILGDKTRMERLAQDSRAFIRPSPSGRTLGGVARRTRESLLLCEAAGFDVVLIETVGVGQSETLVADMVDTFLVLMLPGAGDELQGIKKGLLELADVIAVNKADGDNLPRAREARREYLSALRYLHPRSAAWTPPVLLMSALTGQGIPELWEQLEAHRSALMEAGEFEERRRIQQQRWMWSLIEAQLLQRFQSHPGVQARLAATECAVLEGALTAVQGAELLLAQFAETPSE